MKEEDIRAEIIAEDIVKLTDSLDNAHDLDIAWIRITEALRYLSAKDTMYKTKEDMKNAKKEREKIYSACEAFACVPCLAVVVDQNTEQHEKKIHGFMMPFEHFLAMHPPSTKILSWKMSDSALESYRQDDKVKMFVCDYEAGGWL